MGCSEPMPITVGPWGGAGGSDWATDLNGAVGVEQVIVRHGSAVDSVVFRIFYGNGPSKWSPRFGGKGGDRTDKLTFNWPDEILTSIEGYYSVYSWGCTPIVRSLKFVTNRSMYGPFGSETGTPFFVPVSGGKIVGFHGRSGTYLDAIGVCLVPLACCAERQVISSPVKFDVTADAASMLSTIPRWPTLWGGIGGRPWDDGVFAGVKSILVCREQEDVVRSITIEYDRNGKSVFLHHGGPEGKIQDRIRIAGYPDEYLVSLDGYHGPVEGSGGFEVIKSLTFYTNKAKYGPIGREVGNFFSSFPSLGKVVGMFGRSGVYLDALGVHMEYF